MPVRQDSRNESWFFRFKYKGRNFQEHGFRTSAQAKEAERRKLDQVIHNHVSPDRAGEKLTFVEAGTWFLENHAKPNKRSWVNDQARVGAMMEYFGNRLLSEITPEDVDTFLQWVMRTRSGRSGKRLSEHTRNHYLAMLKALINRLRRRRIYHGDNPAIYVDMKKVPRARVRFLYPAEEKQLSPAVARDRIAWPSYFVALHTGMRAGEIAAMRVEDVSVLTRTIFIPNSKSGRSRHVPVSEHLARFLSQRIAGKKPSDYALEGVVKNYVSRRFRVICRQVGLTDFLFHDLRHTFAQRLLAKGEPIYKVSKILGHSSVVVTEQHYGHLALADLQGTIDQIDGVINLPVIDSLETIKCLDPNESRSDVAAKLPQANQEHAAKLEKIIDNQPIGEVA